jgi:3-oxoacyl-[acyl-carrier protein] reductase
LARGFAEGGAKVVIIGRNINGLKRISDEIGISYAQADVGYRKEIVRAFEKITRNNDKIDVLINCAGIVNKITTKTSLEEAEKKWDEMIRTNLKGCFLACMAATSHLRKPGGNIINVSSIAAFSGGRKPGQIGYAASKSGLHGLTYALAKELAPAGIRVNLIAPGFVSGTDLFGGESKSRAREVASITPLNRVAEVEDIFNVARFLTSDEASFITGEIININGGLLFSR